ncbi:hypothetical protein N403_03720 [Helicobacter pylori FD430]|nr:hypothetical protein N402_05325 [Helicobacter pylori FD423]EQL50774.1 hypothetical protein N403_03720 [Helicobacter pylori FD430]EQL73061.1 hypothetical protein N409_05845 [Helicobacter pylori FD719]KMZ47463.1 hypothetical protein AC784_03220 [Helicobacter pylori]KNE11333.1 hypothetical protein ACM26_00340 [Helicobacter pylori]
MFRTNLIITTQTLNLTPWILNFILSLQVLFYDFRFYFVFKLVFLNPKKLNNKTINPQTNKTINNKIK